MIRAKAKAQTQTQTQTAPANIPEPTTDHHKLTLDEKLYSKQPWTVEQLLAAYDFCQAIVVIIDEDFDNPNCFRKPDPRHASNVECTTIEQLLECVLRAQEISMVLADYWSTATPSESWMG